MRRKGYAMKKKKDRITGGILAVAAAAYIASSFSIRVFEGAGKTAINAGTIPRIWGMCLLFLSLVLIFRKEESPEGQETAPKKRMTARMWTYENYAVMGTFFLMAVYIFLMDKVGYLLDTWAYLIFQILLLSSAVRKNWLAVIIVSTAVSAGTCYVFTHWLGVPLPAGILTL